MSFIGNSYNIVTNVENHTGTITLMMAIYFSETFLSIHVFIHIYLCVPVYMFECRLVDINNICQMKYFFIKLLFYSEINFSF